MTSSKTLVFFGNERLVSGLKQTDTPILRGLIERGYTVAAVVVNHADGTSRSARTLEVAQLAEQHGIPVLSPDKPADIITELTAMKPDAAVLSAYGRILSKRVINVFEPIGIINIHPSLLPRHRGPTPIETTILEGDTEAGVSIMRLDVGMDDGPIYGQVTCAIDSAIDKFGLYKLLSETGANLFFELLPDILNGSLQPKSQEKNGVTFTSLISKELGHLQPMTDDATTLERKIRAFQGYPKPHLTLHGNDVIVTTSKVVVSPDPTKLIVECRDNTYLEITSLLAPSGRQMSGEDFLRGYAK
jgi:methionyl-tRNA formyltransferase